MKRALPGLLGLIFALALSLAAASPVAAAGFTDDSSDGGSDKGGSGTSESSSPTVVEEYKTSDRSCQVYGNAAGMGYYCVSSGAKSSKSLRERFGGQKLQRCRYSDVPDVLEPSRAEHERHAGEDGQFMLMSCLNNIDFDTYSGGRDRVVDISVVWVPAGTDTADRHNPISDFLWNQAESGAQMPVPFMETEPNPRPLVGTPTFFTFKWLDPASKEVSPDGPVKQITDNGMRMRATASKIRVDPNQKDMKPVTCDAAAPYAQGEPASAQPAGACKMTFKRTSASARKLATESIPENVKDAFYLTIEVDWRIQYGESGSDMRTLGDGFTMKLHQALPVQEVQALNQPPYSIY